MIDGRSMADRNIAFKYFVSHVRSSLFLSLSLFVSLRLAYQRHSLAVDKKRNLLLDLLPDNLRFFFFKNHSDSAGLVSFDFVSHFLSFPSHFLFCCCCCCNFYLVR